MQVLLGLLLEVGDVPGWRSPGFDYEVSSRVRLDVTADEPGQVLVPGRLLSDIVRSLPAQPVDLRVEGTRVVLTCGRRASPCRRCPVEDYPALPAMPATAGTLGSDVFAAAVAQVALAAGRDDTLPVLTGVRFEIEGETLTLAATDRYRLAVRTLPWRPRTPACRRPRWCPPARCPRPLGASPPDPRSRLALSSGSRAEG
jgi:DNA polymerase-3 subunit beta